jgi:hypothetical protein
MERAIEGKVRRVKSKADLVNLLGWWLAECQNSSLHSMNTYPFISPLSSCFRATAPGRRIARYQTTCYPLPLMLLKMPPVQLAYISLAQNAFPLRNIQPATAAARSSCSESCSALKSVRRPRIHQLPPLPLAATLLRIPQIVQNQCV